MKYYIQRHGRVEGPLTVDEINSRIAAGAVDSSWFATADLGEGVEGILSIPKRDWVHVTEIPGIPGISDVTKMQEQNSSDNRSIGAAVILILIALALLFGFLHFQRMFGW